MISKNTHDQTLICLCVFCNHFANDINAKFWLSTTIMLRPFHRMHETLSNILIFFLYLALSIRQISKLGKFWQWPVVFLTCKTVHTLEVSSLYFIRVLPSACLVLLHETLNTEAVSTHTHTHTHTHTRTHTRTHTHAHAHAHAQNCNFVMAASFRRHLRQEGGQAKGHQPAHQWAR